MKLFDYYTIDDFGREVYVNILCTPVMNLIEVELDWDDYPTRIPYFGFNLFGTFSAIGLKFGIWKLRFQLDFFVYCFKNLDDYRKFR